MNCKILTVLMTIMLPATCLAERLMPINFSGQPLMNLKEGAVDSCGVRFVGFTSPANPSNKEEQLWVSDASFMLVRGGVGIVKAVLSKTTVGNVNENKLETISQSFKTFWIKVDGEDSTKPINGDALDGETKGSKLYATKAVGLMRIYNAFVNKEPVQIGYKFNNDLSDLAFFGNISISGDEFNQINLCMNELLEKMHQDANRTGNN